MTPYPSAVRIWEENISIPTYPPPPPDLNPMFFEKRVNQGASGRVYPNPFTDHVNHETKIDQEYHAVFLENEYIQLMVLPRFGGRVHVAHDKTNGYNFVYRQNVIKPGLIGLFGSWISGGMEFNWPMHHRPSTFMPVEYVIEKGDDGSATLWLSEHEPMNRMKGMIGICVYPGRAYFEFKVQLYNRTPLPQPFLFWTNTAVRVNENYQVIFPPDVESVTFHSRASMASYPIARELFAGCDFREGVDISFPNNVGPATSYFANPSKYDFFGGYDHGEQGGIIHISDHHTSPGKKCFTWGTGKFGTEWQSSLTDSDGPYIELMASSYSDNQPDFTWLQPFETKIFKHIWYPIQQIGSIKNANRRLAVNLEDDFAGVCATEVLSDVQVILTSGDNILFEWQGDLIPGEPLTIEFEQPADRISVLDSFGNELITYAPQPRRNDPLPETAKPPTPAHKIDNLEELYLTGLHVEQYLHFSLDPAPYWERALELDPGDSRSNNALGRLKMRRGDFAGAESHFRAAIATLTRYNFNPYDGEPQYNLGLALKYQCRYDEAYDTFYKGTWTYALRTAGFYALAQIDVLRGDETKAIDHLERALATNIHHNQARGLKAAVLRRMGRLESALQTTRQALEIDPLNLWARCELLLALVELDDPEDTGQIDFASSELTRLLRGSAQNYLDLALDYADGGLYAEASDILLSFLELDEASESPQATQDYPIIFYALAYFNQQLGNDQAALEWYRQAAQQPPDWCFPHRPQEQIILEAACAANPSDGRAAYYLGNLYYDQKQYDKAIEAWKAATELAPSFSIPWRNLSMALFNKRGDKEGAKRCYQKALHANPDDPRLIMEHDQLFQRLGGSPEQRLAALEMHRDLVEKRDDLSVTLAELYNQTGQSDKALDILNSHIFHPWEGGEGHAATQYALANLALGEAALKSDPTKALAYFETARQNPENLGVGSPTPMIVARLNYATGQAYQALGKNKPAEKSFRKVLDAETGHAFWQSHSLASYYAALAMKALGDKKDAQEKLEGLRAWAEERLNAEEEGGFYTSIPAAVIFEDQPGRGMKIYTLYLLGLANQELGNQAAAKHAFEAILKIDPYHVEAKRLLA